MITKENLIKSLWYLSLIIIVIGLGTLFCTAVAIRMCSLGKCPNPNKTIKNYYNYILNGFYLTLGGGLGVWLFSL